MCGHGKTSATFRRDSLPRACRHTATPSCDCAPSLHHHRPRVQQATPPTPRASGPKCHRIPATVVTATWPTLLVQPAGSANSASLSTNARSSAMMGRCRTELTPVSSVLRSKSLRQLVRRRVSTSMARSTAGASRRTRAASRVSRRRTSSSMKHVAKCGMRDACAFAGTVRPCNGVSCCCAARRRYY
jgi:hypothetical protein